MQLRDNILSYASEHPGPFKKKDLVRYLQTGGEINETSLNTLLSRLVTAGKLQKTGWGEYALPQGGKYKWVLRPQAQTAELFSQLQRHYPLADFCVWDAGSVVPYMLHVPNVKMTIVDVERFLVSTFFEAIKEMFPSTAVLISPSKEDYYKYGAGRECIVVNPLYTESPLETLEGIVVPAPEKVLVDIAVNPEFDYLQGSEIFTIYENVLRDCILSIPKLRRYARRRRCSAQIQRILDNINTPGYD